MASRSLNKVLLIGNLTRDPELRYTPNGIAVCTFGLATNRSWVTEAGEKREEAEFHRIVSWNKLAELCNQLLKKGVKTFVEGRIQTRTWTGSDGKERTTTEIVIDEMIILDSRRTDAEYVPPSDSEAPVVASEPIPTPVASARPATDDTKKKGKAVKKTEEEGTAGEASSQGEQINPDDIPF